MRRLTDPRFLDIPLDRLLSNDYAAERRALIDSYRALSQVEPGLRFGDQAGRQSPGGDTCYFCTADSDGLVVSIIQSIYHDFGSAVIGGDTGTSCRTAVPSSRSTKLIRTGSNPASAPSTPSSPRC